MNLDFASLKREFQPQQLFPNLVGGAVVSIVNIALVTAYSVLIFSGGLEKHIATGVNMLLFGTAIMAIITMLRSTFSGTLIALQEGPIAILAVAALAITDDLGDGPTAFATLVCVIGAAGIVTGLVFYALGHYQLGNLIRFIPYPVIGGFLAGTGLLLALGGLSVAVNETINLTTWSPLFDSGAPAKWLASMIFGVILIVATRRISHYAIMPGLIILAIVLFYGGLLISGSSENDAAARGWLIETTVSDANDATWPPLTQDDFDRIDFDAVWHQAGNILAIVIVSALTLLLNITGIEFIGQRDINVNQELKNAGLANVLAGLGGSSPGTHILSDTALLHRLKAQGRLVYLVHAGLVLLVLAWGSVFLDHFPKFVMGGLLVYLGLDLLDTWVYQSRTKLPRVEYSLVIAIMLVIALLGFLEGIAVGLLAAIALFIVNYSQTGIIRHTLTGQHIQSNVIRPRLYEQMLRKKGDWIYVIKLQGYLFLGTANQLFEHVKTTLDTTKPHFVIFDCQMLTGLDASAVVSFVKIEKLAAEQDTALVFAYLPIHIEHKLMPELSMGTPEDRQWRTFPDLDHALEWCEDRSIERFESVGLTARTESKTIIQQLTAALPSPADYTRMMTFFKREDFAAGATLIQQGDPPSGILFIEEGRVSIHLNVNEQKSVRLRTMNAGTFVGELGVYMNQPASATVIADEASTIYRLHPTELARMEEQAPEIASALHLFMVRFMAERLIQTTDALQSLVK